MAATKLEKHIDDPLEIELLAIFRGLKLCLPMDILSLTVESDSLLAILALEVGASSLVWQVVLFRKFFHFRKFLLLCNFQHVSQLGNRVTHKFARFACQRDDICTWWDFVSDFLQAPMWVDANPLPSLLTNEISFYQ